MDGKSKIPARLRLGSAVFLCLLVFLPFLQRQLKIFPRVELHGEEIKPEKPPLTFQTWFDGGFAEKYDKRFAYKIGFRGICVKTLHQLKYMLFRDIRGNSKTAITLGKNSWLYETAYIEHALEREVIAGEERRRFVADLGSLQTELGKRGIEFVLVVSPSKVSIVPEYLPDDIKNRMPEEPGTYDVLLPELRSMDVNVIDARAFFTDLGKTEKYLFSPCSTHWSYYGSFLFCRHLLGRLQPDFPGRIVLPELAGKKETFPQGTDKDLARLLNLLFSEYDEIKLPYPEVSVDALPRNKRLDALLIGDSFVFTLIDSLAFSKAVNKVDLFHYNKTLYDYPAKDLEGLFWNHTKYRAGAITPESVDWNETLLSKDLVILEINEIYLEDGGWGFARLALDALQSEK